MFIFVGLAIFFLTDSEDGDKKADVKSKSYAYEEDGIDYDNTNDYLSVEDLKEFLLVEFNNSSVSSHECHRVVLFYERQKVERNYGKEALGIMRGLDDFIIYEKGELPMATKDFVNNN